jgi:hypothetical protein
MLRSSEMFLIAHITIPILFLPEPADQSQALIYLISGESLPRIEDSTHWYLPLFKQDVNVVRHHDPCAHPVALGIEEEKSFLDQRRNFWSLKVAGAVTAI